MAPEYAHRTMRLHTPNSEEIATLLTGPLRFCGWTVVEDSLPPSFLLERALDTQSTDWLVPRLLIDDGNGELVGSACFKSEPKDGTVEIGYGVSALRRGRGLATAGVALLVQEAFASPLVDTVVASTVPTNTASQRVLEKSGFVVTGAGVDEDEGPVEVWTKRET